MENQERQPQIEQGLERMALIINTLYGFFMSYEAARNGVYVIVPYFIIVVLVLCWIMNITSFSNQILRINMTLVLLRISVVTYSYFAQNVFSVLACLVVLILTTGLFGISDLMTIEFWTVIFVVVFHFGFNEEISFYDLLNNKSQLFQIINIFVAIIVVNIWIRKRAQVSEKMKDTIIRLSKAEQSKDSFLINASHEIRTPINTICGISEIMMEKDLDDEIRKEMRRMHSAGQNLLAVVNDIMDFSELQSEKVKIEEEVYSIASTISDIISVVEARMKDPNIEFIIDCDSDIPTALIGDEKKIRRVLLNLLDNAMKFTEEGYICLRVRCRKESYGVNLSFYVKDTGIGMKQESMEELFTVFNQADVSRNRQYGGIGLGINISQKLVRLMGGVMTVESEYGKGSVFCVVIPQKVADPKPMTRMLNPEKVRVGVYVNLEQFNMRTVRDEYSTTIRNIVEQQRVKCAICRNLSELKRRESRDGFSHVFITAHEYNEDRVYFDELARRTKILLVLDKREKDLTCDTRIQKIYKPFYFAPIVAALDSGVDMDEKDVTQLQKQKSFITPDVHVLIVDDNAMNLHVIEGLLEKYEMKTSTALSGMEAVNMVDSKEYDFIFMDHMMPGMDGIETFKAIREKTGSYFKQVPIIALTANAVAGSREIFLEEGFQDFLEKPIERNVLERVLMRNIPKRKIIFQDMADENETVVEVKEENINSQLLDFETGCMYCGGQEKYMSVLQAYAPQADSNIANVRALYEEKNWKDYTITVHGVKSFAASIGAKDLSEKARALEMAGKGNDIDYIQANHNNMLNCFEAVVTEIKRVTGYNKEKDKNNENKQLIALRQEEFDKTIKDFEDAVYSFDEEKMLNIVKDLKNCSYNGKSLEEMMSVMQRKVEIGDYMSAMDMISSVKEVNTGAE